MSIDDELQNSQANVLTTMEHYLVSLGHSLHRAQERLAKMATLTGDGEVVYQVPRLDFDFKIAMELDEDDEGDHQLRMRSADGMADQSSGYIASSIKGALVAVPVQAGRARPRLSLEVKSSPGELRVTAIVVTLHGEPVANAPVSFDVRGEETRLPSEVHFKDSLERTDDRGRTTNTLIAPPMAESWPCSVRVEVMGQVLRLRYVIPAAGAAQ